MHHIVALHWLCFFFICWCLSPLSRRVPTMWSMTPMKSYTIFRSARQAKPPCSFRYNPTLSLLLSFTALGQQHSSVTCCGSWTPLSSAWPVIATVNRWNPLAWVGVVWALLCLLIHACLSCLLLLRVESGLIHRGWIRGVWTCPTVCELGVWTRFGNGSGERPCRSTWWVVSLQPSSGTELCLWSMISYYHTLGSGRSKLSRLINQLDLCPGVATSFWCL